jgi:hypothetical protein
LSLTCPQLKVGSKVKFATTRERLDVIKLVKLPCSSLDAFVFRYENRVVVVRQADMHAKWRRARGMADAGLYDNPIET